MLIIETVLKNHRNKNFARERTETERRSRVYEAKQLAAFYHFVVNFFGNFLRLERNILSLFIRFTISIRQNNTNNAKPEIFHEKVCEISLGRVKQKIIIDQCCTRVRFNFQPADERLNASIDS